MARKIPVLDYARCDPEACASGICLAAVECAYGSLVQRDPYEQPEINPAKWCHSCAKCALVCPRQAIRMM